MARPRSNRLRRGVYHTVMGDGMLEALRLLSEALSPVGARFALVHANASRLDHDYLRRWADALGISDRPWESSNRA